METLFLKKSPSFTNKLSRAKQNFSVTYDDIKTPDDVTQSWMTIFCTGVPWSLGYESNS
jgi:hypothetical protein